MLEDGDYCIATVVYTSIKLRSNILTSMILQIKAICARSYGQAIDWRVDERAKIKDLILLIMLLKLVMKMFQ